MITIRLVAVSCLLVGCTPGQARQTDSDSAKFSQASLESRSQASAAGSARAFAQTFYDWYVPLGDKLPGSRYDSVLVVQARMFASTLLAALKEDLDAQRRSPGEIVSVGGDYDPYLNSQDPCERYDAREAVPSHAGYTVSIYGVCAGRNAHVDVLADVERNGASWVFTNFRIPNRPQYDLLSQLRTAKAQRDSTRR